MRQGDERYRVYPAGDIKQFPDKPISEFSSLEVLRQDESWKCYTARCTGAIFESKEHLHDRGTKTEETTKSQITFARCAKRRVRFPT